MDKIMQRFLRVLFKSLGLFYIGVALNNFATIGSHGIMPYFETARHSFSELIQYITSSYQYFLSDWIYIRLGERIYYMSIGDVFLYAGAFNLLFFLWNTLLTPETMAVIKQEIAHMRKNCTSAKEKV